MSPYNAVVCLEGHDMAVVWLKWAISFLEDLSGTVR